VSSSSAEYEVVWPSSRRHLDEIDSTTPLGSLDGKRIAFIWDYIFKGDVMFRIIAEELSKQYPTLDFVGPDEMGNIHGPDEGEVVAALPERLRELAVDAAIVGVGA
jgi:hypothetical protein